MTRKFEQFKTQATKNIRSQMGLNTRGTHTIQSTFADLGARVQTLFGNFVSGLQQLGFGFSRMIGYNPAQQTKSVKQEPKPEERE